MDFTLLGKVFYFMKILQAFLLIFMIVFLFSCGGGSSNQENQTDSTQSKIDNNRKLSSSLRGKTDSLLNRYEPSVRAYIVFLKERYNIKDRNFPKSPEYRQFEQQVLTIEPHLDSLVPELKNTEYLDRYQTLKNEFDDTRQNMKLWAEGKL